MTTTITPIQAKLWLQNGEAILLDVRTPDEFKADHIPFALSVPLANLDASLGDIARSGKRLIFQCQRGTRGASACGRATDLAPSVPVHNIDGGIEGWKRAGFATIVSAGDGASMQSLFRQVQTVLGVLIVAGTAGGFTVSPNAFLIPGALGLALIVSGMTGWCGLAKMLQAMPWNRAG